MSLREGMIFGLCNPLLDVTANVDLEFLKKYNLKENTVILGDESNFNIYEEMEKIGTHHLEFTPGGAIQNTMRCASWILKHPNIATYMGCVGKDRYADIMKEKANSVGLNVVYQYNNKQPTGRCAVLITGKSRTLVAHLYAANSFTVEHLDDPANWAFVEKATVHYVSGFFLTVCMDAIMQVAKFSHSHDTTFSMNLSATFLSQFYAEQFKQVFPYVKLLFGNSDEAMAFSKYVIGVETDDIKSIAKSIANLPSLSEKKRIVVITQGGDPVIIAIGDEIKTFDVPKIASEKIIDTNGAGDAFVGGFLAQYVKGEPIEKCVECGIWASAIVIQRNGCTFPDNVEFK